METKTCGARASKNKSIYSRKELEAMAVERLGWTVSRARGTKKVTLCEALGVEWKTEPAAADEMKVCSARGKKALRYTKEELIDRIRVRNPYINRSRFGRYPFKTLCRLAGLPYAEADAATHANRGERREDPNRFFEEEEVVMGDNPLVRKNPCLERGTKKPFAYQARVVEHFRHHRGLIAVHSMGSGKTLTAIYASQCYLDEHPTHTVVLVSPTSLIENFKKEMRSFGDLRYGDRYEFFSIEGFYKRYKETGRDCRNTFLIVDEAHNLRTENRISKKGKELGKQTGAITKCAEKADRVLLLTATPLVNRPSDIASLLNMIRNDPTPENKIVAKQINDAYVREIGRCRFSFYERGRVSVDYPRVEEENVYLPMPARFMAVYNKIQQELEDEEVLRAFGSETKLRSFYNGIRRAVNILSELPEEDMIKSPKIKWILSRLREEPGQKTVIFSHFLDHGLKSVQNRLPAGVRSEYITGSQSKAKRAEIVRRYNNDEIDVLFLSKAGGEGLDLKKTRRIILLESAWNENTEKQVIGRGVRYKSHEALPLAQRHVKIYRLFHIKPSEMDHIDHLLSEEHEIVFQDPDTWISADLMLKKISARKQRVLDQFARVLKSISIERDPDCATGTTPIGQVHEEENEPESVEVKTADRFPLLRTELEALEARRRTMRGTREEMEAFVTDVNQFEKKLVDAYKHRLRRNDPYAFFASPRFHWQEVMKRICPNRKCILLLEKYLQDFPPPIFPLHRRTVELVINNRTQGGASILPYLDLMVTAIRGAHNPILPVDI